jgi:murein DD-endopeptidase MepM/ murein hydrolase activator NlpD
VSLRRPISKPIPPARKRPLFLILTLAAVLAVSLAAYVAFHRSDFQAGKNVPGGAPAGTATGKAPEGTFPPAALAKFLRLPPPLTVHRTVIFPGQTLAGILAAYGFSPADVHKLMEQTRSVFDLSAIQAGREMRFFREPKGRLAAVEYDINDTDFVRLRPSGVAFQAEVHKYPVASRLVMIEGRLEDYLISAFNQAGEGDLLALDFAEIFAWDVDFYIDPQRGDRFRLLFEKKFKCGQPVGYGRILAAEFLNHGRLLQAYRFTYSDTGKSDYFNAAGNSLRKEFLRSPLKFGRITSRFTSSRYHPIRKIYRAHYAIDYAAPVGTPVWATADGEILTAGWSGGAGRLVKIKHKNGYQSLYLHLSGFGEGIRAGAKVEAGQVIGYVGSTGESTGPHLDYRLLQHGKPINPLGGRFKPAEPLRPEFLGAFQRQAAEYRLVQDVQALPRQVLARLASLFDLKIPLLR